MLRKASKQIFGFVKGKHRIWGLAVDLVEEADEFLMPVAAHTLSDDPALQHVERGKQCRGTIPLVVVRHRSAAALLHRQVGLGAVERLDLRLFVNR
jgi:hypothetical protein